MRSNTSSPTARANRPNRVMKSSSKADFSTKWSATRASPQSHVTRRVSMISRSGCQIGSSCHVCRALLQNSGWDYLQLTHPVSEPLDAPHFVGSLERGGDNDT
jgi:hypothetical protein